MLCNRIQEALRDATECAITDEGARVATHCLYPSLEPVVVLVAKYGDGFKVHDGGGAVRSAWDHGRDMAAIKRALKKQADTYALGLIEDVLVADVPSFDWLLPAILAVANASAVAALSAVERAGQTSEESLNARIEAVLRKLIEPSRIATNYEVHGRSGKRYGFDFAIRHFDGRRTLINGVVPHHTSISAKYVAFSDTREDTSDVEGRFAIYDRPLENDDAALLQQVAALVPIGMLSLGLQSQRGIVHR